jgi:hypothetical protein
MIGNAFAARNADREPAGADAENGLALGKRARYLP